MQFCARNFSGPLVQIWVTLTGRYSRGADMLKPEQAVCLHETDLSPLVIVQYERIVEDILKAAYPPETPVDVICAAMADSDDTTGRLLAAWRTFLQTVYPEVREVSADAWATLWQHALSEIKVRVRTRIVRLHDLIVRRAVSWESVNYLVQAFAKSEGDAALYLEHYRELRSASQRWLSVQLPRGPVRYTPPAELADKALGILALNLMENGSAEEAERVLDLRWTQVTAHGCKSISDMPHGAVGNTAVDLRALWVMGMRILPFTEFGSVPELFERAAGLDEPILLTEAGTEPPVTDVMSMYVAMTEAKRERQRIVLRNPPGFHDWLFADFKGTSF